MKALLKKIEENGMQAYVTFETSIREVPEIPQGFLDVTIKKWKDHRSREALNYLWQIVTEIAEEVGEDKESVYVSMVNSYGILERDDENQLIEIVVAAGLDVDKLCVDGLYLHQTPYSMEKYGRKYYIYWKVKRPSEYDSKEFAMFTDRVKGELDEIRNSI